MADLIIIAIIVVAVAVVVRNYIAKRGHSDCCGDDDSVRLKSTSSRDAGVFPHAYTVEVNGMSCDNCAHRVANAFNERPGYLAEVDLATGLATVRTKEPASADELTRVVRNAGYGAGKVNELS